jgi:hypothetical protein
LRGGSRVDLGGGGVFDGDEVVNDDGRFGLVRVFLDEIFQDSSSEKAFSVSGVFESSIILQTSKEAGR